MTFRRERSKVAPPVAADASASSSLSRLRAPSLVTVLGLAFVLVIALWLVVNLIKTPSDFFEVTAIGITNGSVYALVALGYTLVYGILELINFANGDVFMLGGMFTITYANHFFGLHQGQGAIIVLWVAFTLVLVMLTCGGLNAMIEFFAYRPLAQRPSTCAADHGDRRQLHHRERRARRLGTGVRDRARRPSTQRRLQHRGLRLPVEQVHRGDHHRARAARPHVPGPEHAAGEGDARDRPGQGCERDDGHQRQPDDLVHVPDRRSARGRRGRRLLAVLHERQVRPGVPARSDRLHRRRARRDRQPAGRRPRSGADRPAPGLERGTQLACARARTGRSRSSSRSSS